MEVFIGQDEAAGVPQRARMYTRNAGVLATTTERDVDEVPINVTNINVTYCATDPDVQGCMERSCNGGLVDT